MTNVGFSSCVAAAVLGLVGTAPALAAQPYPLNYKTFAFSASDSTRSGTAFSGGSLVLGSSGLGALTYADPFANYSGDGVDGSGDYVSGTWTSGVTQSVVRVQRARLVVEREHAVRHLGAGRGAAADSTTATGPSGTSSAAGRPTTTRSTAPRSAARATPTASSRSTPSSRRTTSAIAYRLRATLYRKAGATAGPTLTRLSAIASNLTNQKGSFPSKTTMTGTAVDLGVPAVLAGDPPRRLPAVRQRRRGLVQPDLDLDGRRLLVAEDGHELQPDAGRVLVGDGGTAVAAAPGSVGRLHRPRGLRLPLQRRRQLAVQRGLRGLTRARRAT